MKTSFLKLALFVFIGMFIGAMNGAIAAQQAQQRLTGKVTDQQGNPVIGATIAVVGTTNGTLSATDGTYTLTNVPAEGRIQVSFVGYIAQIADVEGRTTINFTLQEETTVLDEVVVVGYGVQKKINVTGAISTVSSTDMVNRSVENVGQTVQGKLSGVQVLNVSGRPGASSAFRIRGYSSAISSPDPLFLVDGLKVSNIDYLDPESIESIQVLKDAASAAIYGAQAGNGVVMITTKTGGKDKGKGQLFYNSIYAFSDPIRSMNMMNAGQFKEYWTESGRVNPEGFQNADTDWQDIVLETGFQQRHTVGGSFTTEKGTYYMAATLLRNNGIVTGDKDVNERVTGQINASFKIKDWITLGTTNSIERGYTHTVTENNFTGTGSAVGSAYYFDPTVPVFYASDSDVPAATGLLAAEAAGYTVFRDKEGRLYGQSLSMTSNLWNPLLMIDVQTSGAQTAFNKHWRTNLNGTAYAEILPFAGLTFTSRLGYRLSNLYQTVYNSPYWINPAQISTSPEIRGNMMNTNYYQWENFANYNKTILKHEINAMAGMEFASTRFESVRANANGLSSLDEAFQSLDYYLPTASTRTMSGGDYYRANMSYFGRLAYSYDSKYLLQFNFRADAFDNSKLSTKNRWGYFPSVSLGWVLTKENFMQNIDPKILSFAKLRASYGVNGNINALSDFAYTNAMVLSSSVYSLTNSGLLTAAAPSTRLANQNLTWEETTQLNFGLDTRFFSDRLVFSVDYYEKNTTGMITSISAPLISGASTQNVNKGEILNKGFEFDLGWNHKLGDLGYSFNANLTTIHNEVIESPYTAGRQSGGFPGSNFFMPITYLEAGYPMWYMRTFIHKDIDPATGLPIYYSSEELGTDDGKDFAGSGIPDFTYGLTLRLNWKNLDFTAFGSGVHGNKQFMCIFRPDLPVANLPEFVFTDRWTSSNNENPGYPRANSSDSRYAQSDFWIFDASYFKIKQIQLGYTLTSALLNKVHLSALRIYASAENLVTFTKYPGNDPESMSATFGAGIGLDKVSYPSTRNYTIGINVSF